MIRVLACQGTGIACLLLGLLIGSHFLCPSGEDPAMAVGGSTPILKEIVYQSKGPTAIGATIIGGQNSSGYGCSLSDIFWLHIPHCGLSLSLVLIGCT